MAIRTDALRTIAALLLLAVVFLPYVGDAQATANESNMTERYNSLQAWFQRLSQKRPEPGAKAEEIAAFNKECSEYKTALADYKKEAASLANIPSGIKAQPPQPEATKDRADIEATEAELQDHRDPTPNVTFDDPPYGKAGTIGVHVLHVKGKIFRSTESSEFLKLSPESSAMFTLAPGWENEPLLGAGDSHTHVIMNQPLLLIGSSGFVEGDTFEDVVYPLGPIYYTNRNGQKAMTYCYTTSLEFARACKENDPSSAVNQESRRKTGTGFFISSEGHLVTNWHVVNKCNHFAIRTGGHSYDGRLLFADKANDIAVIKIDAPSTPLPIKSSRDVSLGDDVFTIGFPDFRLQGTKPKLTTGSISSLAGIQDDPRYFQISVPIQPGNSGGALVDSKGNIVGIVTATLNVSAVIRNTGGIPQNVNYALKSSLLLTMLESVPEIGKELPAPHNDQPENKGGVIQAAESATAMIVAD